MTLGDSLTLTGLRVDLFANGATTPTSTQALTGNLAPGAVYVIANAGSVASVLAQADGIWTVEAVDHRP